MIFEDPREKGCAGKEVSFAEFCFWTSAPVVGAIVGDWLWGLF